MLRGELLVVYRLGGLDLYCMFMLFSPLYDSLFLQSLHAFRIYLILLIDVHQPIYPLPTIISYLHYTEGKILAYLSDIWKRKESPN
jgi:hypothetical protein